MTSMEKNQTWILVDKPKEQKTVGRKWIFKRKEDIPSVRKAQFKARLVAQMETTQTMKHVFLHRIRT